MITKSVTVSLAEFAVLGSQIVCSGGDYSSGWSGTGCCENFYPV